jgi:AraC-like DNA-binding protein
MVRPSRFSITRFEVGNEVEVTRQARVFGDDSDSGHRLCAMYHLQGAPVGLEACAGCPLAAGEKLLSAKECPVSLEGLDGDFFLLEVKWSFDEPVGRVPECKALEQFDVGSISPLSGRERIVLGELIDAPPMGAFTHLWLEGKSLELLALSCAGPRSGPLKGRQDLINRERAQRVCSILNGEFADPPSLDELARRVGCSKFCLSRTFSEVMGMSIPQFIRERRIHEAASLLRAGRHNVTEAAFAVGYSSLGHFSTAFREIIGCCPGLYPLGFRHLGAAEKTHW